MKTIHHVSHYLDKHDRIKPTAKTSCGLAGWSFAYGHDIVADANIRITTCDDCKGSAAYKRARRFAEAHPKPAWSLSNEKEQMLLGADVRERHGQIEEAAFLRRVAAEIVIPNDPDTNKSKESTP